jgi:hypothetical protein
LSALDIFAYTHRQLGVATWSEDRDILNSPFGKVWQASLWEFKKQRPFLHSHALLGNLPAPSGWAIIYADWYCSLSIEQKFRAKKSRSRSGFFQIRQRLRFSNDDHFD